MANRRDILETALAGLSALGTERDRERIAELRDRLAGARLRVLVAGEAKRGKSTLVNALLGRPVLPTGVTPLTSVATTVRYGEDPRAEVAFADGHAEKHPLAALGELVTERGNPRNRRGIAAVTAFTDAPVLAAGVELVDTPGTGSVFEWDTDAAHRALRTMDAAVFVLTADPPVSASERELLGRIGKLSVRTFAVLNKADRLDAAELAEAAEFTGRVLAEAGQAGPLYPMSARAALDGGDRGFAAFAADFSAYLDGQAGSDLSVAVAGHARRIAASLLDEVALTRRAARLRAGQDASRAERFGSRLAEVATRGRDAAAIAGAESARLLAALNDAAGEAAPRLGRQVAAELEALLAGGLAAAAPGEIERRGRERLVALAVTAAEGWRQGQRERIERDLAAVEARLAAGLRAELDVLRDSAAELLGLDLAVPEPGGRLAPDRRFFYATAEDAGQTELLAGAVRRRLPGELGRRVARGHLRRQVPGLVASLIGRARGDLQYRLAEAARELARAVEQRYADGTGRMQAALRAAAEMRAASGTEAARGEAELAGREAALRRVLAGLGQPSPPDAQPSP